MIKNLSDFEKIGTEDSLYEHFESLLNEPLDSRFESVSNERVEKALTSRYIDFDDYLALMSPKAESFLEEIAQRAHQETLKQFGRQILLYAPLYLSNFCESGCLYCGFSAKNKIERIQLDEAKLRKEAIALAETGIRHVLILTGCSRTKTPVSFIHNSVKILSEYFPTIGLEIFSLEEAEYSKLAQAGADDLTLYQETYDRILYDKIHPYGPKKDYKYRFETPERACRAGFRSVNLGVLLGLSNWRKDLFLAGVHAWFLQRKYPEVEVSLSFPRMRPHEGSFQPAYQVSDKELVQGLTAWRIFMPRGGISLSTRESAEFRDNLLPLGVTKFSAGSCTFVGGYSDPLDCENVGQFVIDDNRSVNEVVIAMKKAGYQPMLKNWQFWGGSNVVK